MMISPPTVKADSARAARFATGHNSGSAWVNKVPATDDSRPLNGECARILHLTTSETPLGRSRAGIEAFVAKTRRPAFLHAFRFDGSISSICCLCQVTIASRHSEIDLRKSEDTHVCRGISLRRMLHPEQAADIDR